MSVLLETSRGDLVIDLYTDDCPKACTNFLKLCKIKYYNNCLFHEIVPNFIAVTGDPTGTGNDGQSINGILYGEQARFFEDEIHPHLRHRKKGTVAMATGRKDMNASQFYITLGVDLDSLDEKHTIFGEVSEGLEVLQAINEAFLDDKGRPLQNIRIRHTIVLEDPFPDPPQLEEHVPESSPPPVFATETDRLEDDWVPTEDTRDAAIIEEENRKLEAEKRAEVLEMVGDLPTADAKPPSDMIFVCKLNPVTTEEDLEIIFSRFGKVTSCDIIRDWKTGDSLNYAFIGFDSDKAAEDAFFKMDNVLIDDRRIHVDFSQSMHHLWRQFKQFGRAGTAADGAQANAPKDAKEVGGKRGRPPPQLELKPGVARGLYAGPAPSAARGREYEIVHEEHEPGPSGRDERHPEREGHRHRGVAEHSRAHDRDRNRDRAIDRSRHENGHSDRRRSDDRDRRRDREDFDRDRGNVDYGRGRNQHGEERRQQADHGGRDGAIAEEDRRREHKDSKREKKEKKEKKEHKRHKSDR